MILAFSFLFSSCEKIKGKGDVVSEHRSIDGYTGISLAMSETVHFIPGTEYSLEIRGQQNIIDNIITHISGSGTVRKL